MRYLRTRKATDWPENLGKTSAERLVRKLLFFIPQADPGYEGKMHLIREWLIEFNDDGVPWREIALGESGEVVVAGPSARDHGFWLDTDMRLEDFDGESEPLTRAEFERLWEKSGVREPP